MCGVQVKEGPPMADLVREYKRAVSDPEIASLRKTITERDKRIAELEAKLTQIAAFAEVATEENWRDIILYIKRAT